VFSIVEVVRELSFLVKFDIFEEKDNYFLFSIEIGLLISFTVVQGSLGQKETHNIN
jgi:hypothetical protein